MFDETEDNHKYRGEKDFFMVFAFLTANNLLLVLIIGLRVIILKVF